MFKAGTLEDWVAKETHHVVTIEGDPDGPVVDVESSIREGKLILVRAPLSHTRSRSNWLYASEEGAKIAADRMEASFKDVPGRGIASKFPPPDLPFPVEPGTPLRPRTLTPEMSLCVATRMALEEAVDLYTDKLVLTFRSLHMRAMSVHKFTPEEVRRATTEVREAKAVLS